MKSSLRTLKIMPRNLNEIVHVHEFRITEELGPPQDNNVQYNKEGGFVTENSCRKFI